jgi:hypothetical protein
MLDLLFGGYATLLARPPASTICGMAQSKLASSKQSKTVTPPESSIG